MFKYFEPNKIFAVTSKAPKYVLFLFIIVLTIGLTEALILSPEDYKLSDAVRIMYVHVPASFIALGCFAFMGTLSICNLVFKIKFLVFFKRFFIKSNQCSIPVICVGNIYMGATGKTPLCIEILYILKKETKFFNLI